MRSSRFVGSIAADGDTHASLRKIGYSPNKPITHLYTQLAVEGLRLSAK